MILLSAPFFEGNEKAYVKDCMESEWVSSSGSYVRRFEQAIADKVGAPDATAVVNGTAALQICLMLAGVQAGDEVIVPAITFIAPINAVKYLGAEPVFMDCDDYLNLDNEKLADFLSRECERNAAGQVINRSSGRRISAILPVHVFGSPCDMNRLMPLAADYGLKVIEDATEALGSSMCEGACAGQAAGMVGDYGCYSFNGNKIITCGGGGMIVSKDTAQLDRARYLTTQAKDDPLYYVHDEIGFNYRLTALQAALGLGQAEQLDRIIQLKKQRYQQYQERLDSVPGLQLLPIPAYCESNYWHYGLMLDPDTFGCSRDALMRRCEAEKIQVRPLWKPNHLQKPYLNHQAYRIEKACTLGDRIVNIPCSAGLTDNELDRVCRTLEEF